jgi:23S rRNA (cytidine1920-2'-O)/16S rRNA (cytidine1409-2'-O)-methyltransferase
MAAIADQGAMSAKQPMRLDQRLVAEGLVASRSRARDLIMRGFVRVDGLVCDKPAQAVPELAAVALEAATPSYVSRGAEKLLAALDVFAFDPAQRICLDAGASTGGFTQLLLERGAAKVYAIDVGTSQLHELLREDQRVIVCETCDIRSVDADLVPEPLGVIVADLSFISVTKALSGVLALAADGAFLVVLVKPQFELTPADIGKGGVVRNAQAHKRAIASVESYIKSQPGWTVTGLIPSPIAGGGGNQEFLLGAVKHG